MKHVIRVVQKNVYKRLNEKLIR